MGVSLKPTASMFMRPDSDDYRPGVALYTVFGLMAGFSGWLLWQCFMGASFIIHPSFNVIELTLFRTGLLPISRQELWRFGFPSLWHSGPLLLQHTPVHSIALQCGCDYHFQRRGTVGSLKLQTVLRHLLSGMGDRRFYAWPNPHVTEVWMARKFRYLDQPSHYLHYHGSCCTLRPIVLSLRIICWILCQPGFSDARCRWKLPSCYA